MRLTLHDREPELPMFSPKPVRFLWLLPAVFFLGIVVLVGLALHHEMKTSALQARWLSYYGQHITFDMQPDATPKMRYPKFGPYNARLGYSNLPFFIKALQADDFTIAAQMRATKTYDDMLRHGLYPIYHPKTVAGLTLYGSDGEKIYNAAYPNHVFDSFDQIPSLLTNTLLYIENRELLSNGSVTRNPVIEWDRFFYAVFGHFLHGIVPGTNAGGGSTLATQTEKFRFSPQGQTGNSMEKIRQIVSASMRVYLDGPDTREARKKILLDYLNSTPLSARPGFGEINSIGDGLWAWFGIDLNDATAALNAPETDAESLKAKAHVYRAALGLILSQRRPSHYLQTNRPALDNLIDATLDRLQMAGVISSILHDATKNATLQFLPEAPPPPQPPYIEQKAVNALRTHLLNLLGLRNLYEVDRLDLSGHTTLDRDGEKKLVEFLQKMNDKNFVQSIGLYGFRLLKPDNDLKKIKWSVVLYERTPDSNKMRLQADNIEGPFDMNEGMKLDLGSTAKLRTLVTYLEIIAELHRRYAGLDPDDLQDLAEDTPDNLTAWAISWLTTHADANLETMLGASLDRQYSGNNAETFFTGGGAHIFHNFEPDENYEVMDLHEAFRRSVNLVFVRVMRDIVNYTIAQGAQNKDDLLDNADTPERKAYLQRFADQEGSVFLNRYVAEYEPLPVSARLEKILTRAHKGAVARTTLFRSLMPDADYATYATFMRAHPSRDTISEARLVKLYHDYAIDKFSLSDRAYLTGVNPMELWLLGYWQQHPAVSHRELMDVSRPIRIASYEWLMRPSLKHAQDTRIRIIMEQDAFAHIQKRWARMGYPFDHLVPSLATAIGSSADRPGALAELVGIILADGVRLPVERFDSLEFGIGTPYQTLLKLSPDNQPQQVLDPAIAHAMKNIMAEVVDNGTAKRVKGTYHDTSGAVMPVGGKTGTGDQRFDEFGHGGQLLSSRVVNRTGTFAFYIGDRFFGAITAHVSGEDAADYAFTSALSAQMLRALAPIINPLITGSATSSTDTLSPVQSNQPLPP